MATLEIMNRGEPMNDKAYYQRRDRLESELRKGAVQASRLASILGWSVDEVAGKLRSLRTDGRATYSDGFWRSKGSRHV